MKKIITTVIMCVFLSGCATPLFTNILIGTSTALTAVDWAQTITIAKNPNKFHEHNPILGKHPSVDKVNIYFGSVIAANLAAHWLLPEKFQPYWYGFLTVLELGVITSNFATGIGF